MDKTVEIIAASCDDRDSLRGFPLILQVNTQSVFLTELRDVITGERVVPIVHSIREAIGGTNIDGVLTLDVVGIREI